MSGAGYAYTTLSAHPGEPVRVGVSFYLDERSWVTVIGAESGRPHLTVSHGDVSVAIGPQHEAPITAEDARIARHLATQAAEYAADIERLSAAASTTPEGGAAGDEAAGDPAA